MKIQRSLQIPKREWENIRASLQMCGDIGEFHSKNHTTGKPGILLISEGLLLVRNLNRDGK